MKLFQFDFDTPTSETVLPEKVTMYRVHVGRRIYGPVRVEDFKRIPGFTLQTPIAPVGTEHWKPAYKAINLQHYFNKPVQNAYTRHTSVDDLKSMLTDDEKQPTTHFEE